MFSFQSKILIYHISHTVKDINHTNDLDVNNALPCLIPTSLRLKHIIAVVAAKVVMISPSPIDFLAAIASTSSLFYS